MVNPYKLLVKVFQLPVKSESNVDGEAGEAVGLAGIKVCCEFLYIKYPTTPRMAISIIIISGAKPFFFISLTMNQSKKQVNDELYLF